MESIVRIYALAAAYGSSVRTKKKVAHMYVLCSKKWANKYLPALFYWLADVTLVPSGCSLIPPFHPLWLLSNGTNIDRAKIFHFCIVP